MRTVAQKMGIRQNCRVLLINAPVGIQDEMDMPEVRVSKTRAGVFDYIHLFVKSQAEFKALFHKLKKLLKDDGMFWVSWPKSGQLDTDLSLPQVINIGYNFGLVESTCLSINSVWSALKFTHPKKGKVYNNSYGTLNLEGAS